MTPAKFRDLRSHFDRLVDLPPDVRSAFLAEIAARDSALASELGRLLAARDSSPGVLDQSPADAIAASMTAPQPLQPGAAFGPYRLERELGRGGMGVVWLATRADGSFQKRAAIKILRRDCIDPSFLARFQREREILAQFDHPHITSIVDAGQSAEGDPYFVMEYVDGLPLSAWCQAHSPSTRQKLDLFLQICDAVQHAHRNLTVHRDLKPGNILVTQAGAVKLLDFGIAKLLVPSVVPAEPAATQTILTPEYSSPEQISSHPVTTLSDVFSLGILLYELLAGRHPFHTRGTLPHQVMRAIAEDDPPMPCGAVRGELQAIVATALRKDPAWRYPSVEQLATDINRYRRGLPVLATGSRWPYRLRKFVRRQWLPLTATAVVILALVGGVVSTKREAAGAELARAHEAQQRARAEQNQRAAETSQRQAEQNQRLADQQRALADARAREAERERQKERARYRDIRALAASLLFELHDGIRDLAGSATARRLVVEKAQQQLELLRADSGNDPALQRDLAAAYERMGELRVDPSRSKQGSAVLDAYRRAVSLRRALAAAPGATQADRRDLALSLAHLADGQFFAGDMKSAVDSEQQAWTLAQSLARSNPGDPPTARALGFVDERRCSILFAAGSNAAALDACREGIATLTPLASGSPDDIEIQRSFAAIHGAYANALRFSGKPAEAAQQAAAAAAAFDRLERLTPANAEYRRLAASNQTILAASLAAAGDSQGSLDAFRRAVHSTEIALEIDPSDLASPLRLAVTLLAFSRRLAAAGKTGDAHDAASQALRLLDQTAARPGAGPLEWNEYADALLKAGFPDLVQPAKALELATRSVAATGRKNPAILDTLAWAYFRTGDQAAAVATEREALSLVPAGPQGGLHHELQQGLNEFLKKK